MENILEELYYGNINPQDKCFDRDSEYAKFVKIIADNEEKLDAFLRGISAAEKEHKLFSQLMDAHSSILVFSEKERFIEGFQLGARLMLDTFLIPWGSVIRDIC